MNLEDFNLLAREKFPFQNFTEWLYFLEFTEAYFKNRDISHPIIVELGVQYNHQKLFYEKFLGAEYIGIDSQNRRGIPDILGDTSDEETLNKLKAKLNGRAINLLFIDAGHYYDEVVSDYEMYGPLVQNIIALHDVVHKDPTLPLVTVYLLWEEIMNNMRNEDKYTKLLVSLEPVRFGIGMVIKE